MGIEVDYLGFPAYVMRSSFAKICATYVLLRIADSNKLIG